MEQYVWTEKLQGSFIKQKKEEIKRKIREGDKRNQKREGKKRKRRKGDVRKKKPCKKKKRKRERERSGSSVYIAENIKYLCRNFFTND